MRVPLITKKMSVRLAVCYSKPAGKLALPDEFETGLHHTKCKSTGEAKYVDRSILDHDLIVSGWISRPIVAQRRLDPALDRIRSST